MSEKEVRLNFLNQIKPFLGAIGLFFGSMALMYQFIIGAGPVIWFLIGTIAFTLLFIFAIAKINKITKEK